MTWEIILDIILTILLIFVGLTELLILLRAWDWVKNKLRFKTKFIHIEKIELEQEKKGEQK